MSLVWARATRLAAINVFPLFHVNAFFHLRVGASKRNLIAASKTTTYLLKICLSG